MTSVLLLYAALVSFTAIAAYTDLRTGLIPNRLIVVGLVLALPLHAAVHFMVLRAAGDADGTVLLRALGYYTAGVIGCGLVPFILFRYNAMGGGDVKLLAMVGAFVGPMMGIEIQLYAFVLMALFAGARLAYQGQLLKLLSNSALLLVNPLRAKSRRRAVPEELLTSLRFAPAVFVSALLLTGLRLGLSRLGFA
ncbi:MAG TPA: A24 family peptidase [Polyangiaceae bacterium]|nr:A24 family peptidase [Polyangiaceae bacterium]